MVSLHSFDLHRMWNLLFILYYPYKQIIFTLLKILVCFILSYIYRYILPDEKAKDVYSATENLCLNCIHCCHHTVYIPNGNINVMGLALIVRLALHEPHHSLS